ncbi:uncharacterized protein METZ01_LOCUS173759 [marine metagenome]|jgi:serine phosphatase RsbU (regulator of sigma subunit)|uniref:Uncharacterized protein n=1 Tax=marine metagenome TaxID=408172 RepID=A0A382C476_9ZZZZ|tara:strand:- start:35 stop:250 length:216 start_codon:yes stop_codon:yes gene_type:complete
MIDWDALLTSKRNVVQVQQFAFGDTSGKGLYSAFSNTKNGGTVRNLLRTHGVTYSKRLARKALKRRGLEKN